METDIAVSSLYPDLYGFGQTTIYKALRDLDIARFEKEGEGKKVFVSAADKEVLDQYMKLLEEGGRPAADSYARDRRGFSETLPIKAARPPASGPLALELAMPEVLAQMIQAIAVQMGQQRVDTLQPQRQLGEAAVNEWLLSSAQVREILGVKSWSGQARLGFIFVKSGKTGRSTAWRVFSSDDVEAIVFDAPPERRQPPARSYSGFSQF